MRCDFLFSLIVSLAMPCAADLAGSRRCRSQAARLRRHQRAVELHYWRPYHTGRRHVLVAAPIANNVAKVARSMELHWQHDALTASKHHYARHASLAASAVLSEESLKEPLSCHRAANRAKHSLPEAKRFSWADAGGSDAESDALPEDPWCKGPDPWTAPAALRGVSWDAPPLGSGSDVSVDQRPGMRHASTQTAPVCFGEAAGSEGRQAQDSVWAVSAPAEDLVLCDAPADSKGSSCLPAMRESRPAVHWASPIKEERGPTQEELIDVVWNASEEVCSLLAKRVIEIERRMVAAESLIKETRCDVKVPSPATERRSPLDPSTIYGVQRIPVCVDGLQSQALNGCIGFLDPSSRAGGRYAIKLLADGRSRKFKCENIFEYTAGGERCASCGAQVDLRQWPPCDCDCDPVVHCSRHAPECLPSVPSKGDMHGVHVCSSEPTCSNAGDVCNRHALECPPSVLSNGDVFDVQLHSSDVADIRQSPPVPPCGMHDRCCVHDETDGFRAPCPMRVAAT